jgi:hypothetical protein
MYSCAPFSRASQRAAIESASGARSNRRRVRRRSSRRRGRSADGRRPADVRRAASSVSGRGPIACMGMISERCGKPAVRLRNSADADSRTNADHPVLIDQVVSDAAEAVALARRNRSGVSLLLPMRLSGATMAGGAAGGAVALPDSDTRSARGAECFPRLRRSGEPRLEQRAGDCRSSRSRRLDPRCCSSSQRTYAGRGQGPVRSAPSPH